MPPALLAATFAAWLYHHYFVTKQASLDLNAMITLLLIATLLLTRTFARFGLSAIGGSNRLPWETTTWQAPSRRQTSRGD